MKRGWREPVPDSHFRKMEKMLRVRGAANVRYLTRDGISVIMTDEPYDEDSPRLLHISISAEQLGRHPTWEEQRDAIFDLCGGRYMIQVVPPREKFGTLDGSHVFHWWEVPKPPTWLKNLGSWL